MNDHINETIGDLKIALVLLKKDVEIAEKITEQNAKATQRLDDIVNDFAKIISVHESKMDSQHEFNEETTQKLKSFQALIFKKIEESEARLIEVIEKLHAQTEDAEALLDTRVKSLEKAKIIFGAVATAFTFVIIYFGRIVGSFKEFFSQ